MASHRFSTAVILTTTLWATSACFSINGSENQDPSSASRSSTRLEHVDRRSPFLKNPQVGDIYAAEVTHFSENNFGGHAGEPMYGLMKVIHVGREFILLIATRDAWPDRMDALADLHQHPEGVLWELDEKIRVPRDRLLQLVVDRRIVEVMRPVTKESR